MCNCKFEPKCQSYSYVTDEKLGGLVTAILPFAKLR